MLEPLRSEPPLIPSPHSSALPFQIEPHNVWGPHGLFFFFNTKLEVGRLLGWMDAVGVVGGQGGRQVTLKSAVGAESGLESREGY